MVRENKVYLPKLCHMRKKSFWRLSKTLSSILESSCYDSKKLSELYFLFWPLLMSGACHQFRPRRVVFYGCFQYKRSFLSQCWCKGTIFLSRKQEYGKKVRKKSVSIWFIAIYIKLNFAFNIFGKTKVSLRVGDPLLMTPCRNHPAKWHSFRKNFLNSLSIWFSDSYHSKTTQTDSII